MNENQAIYERLRVNLRSADQLFQVVGSDIHALKASGESYRKIAQVTGYPKSTIENYHKAWQVAPNAEALKVGEKEGTFAHALVAHEVAQKVKRSGNEAGVPISTRTIFEDAVQGDLSTRQLRAKYEKQVQDKVLNRLRAEALSLKPESWWNSCHQKDCIEVLESLPDGSVDFAHLDPPYWPYHDSQGENGLRQPSYRGGVLAECANRTMSEAKSVMLRLIPVLARKLAKGGKVLYWNTGLHNDDPHIVLAFEDAGLPNYRAGYWNKGSQAPMEQNSPHTTTFERWLIQSRELRVTSFDYNVSRDNVVLDDTPVPKQRTIYHIMEKPVSLLEKFLRAYCPPNGLVFDAFGCSGSACVAAINLGHRFVYSELKQENFEYGSGRIAEALKTEIKATA